MADSSLLPRAALIHSQHYLHPTEESYDREKTNHHPSVFHTCYSTQTGSVIKAAWINLSPGRSSIMVKFATSIEDSGFGILYCN